MLFRSTVARLFREDADMAARGEFNPDNALMTLDILLRRSDALGHVGLASVAIAARCAVLNRHDPERLSRSIANTYHLLGAVR